MPSFGRPELQIDLLVAAGAPLSIGPPKVSTHDCLGATAAEEKYWRKRCGKRNAEAANAVRTRARVSSIGSRRLCRMRRRQGSGRDRGPQSKNKLQGRRLCRAFLRVSDWPQALLRRLFAAKDDSAFRPRFRATRVGKQCKIMSTSITITSTKTETQIKSEARCP